jgi:hypothetical protein
MKIGIADITASQYGMPALHMEALKKSAEEVGPIGIRPVSKFAKTLLEEEHPTKPFSVKSKTSHSGPAAGMVTVDPLYGRQFKPSLTNEEQKLSPAEKEVIIATQKEEAKEKYQQDIQKAYAQDQFKDTREELRAINLKISQRRLDELITLDQSMKVEKPEKPKSRRHAYRITWGEEQVLEAHAMIEANNKFSILDKDNNPIKVLGRTTPRRKEEAHDEIEEKGITADYDILVICPPYSTFDPGGIDRTPFPTQGLTKGAVENNIAKVKNSDADGPQESAIGGNWSQRTENAVHTINKHISELDPARGHPALSTTHHNAEFNNPFADDLKNNLPSLFVLPKPMDLSAILTNTQKNPTAHNIEQSKHATYVLIETPQEMNLLRNVLRDNGYYWPAHARYAEDIKPFRPEVMELINAAKAVTAERAESKAAANSTLLIMQQIKAKPSKLGLRKFKQEEDTSIDRVTLPQLNPAVFDTPDNAAKQEEKSSAQVTIKPM